MFLKEIKNFIFTAGGQTVGAGTDNGFDGRYEGYALTSQRNGGSARIRGRELNYQQQFTFLPGWLKGFGGFANYTRLETKGDYGAAVSRSTSEVAGFTPEVVNIGVSYIRQPVSIRLHFNHASRYLQTFNQPRAAPLQDRPFDGRPQDGLHVIAAFRPVLRRGEHFPRTRPGIHVARRTATDDPGSPAMFYSAPITGSDARIVRRAAPISRR